MKLGWGLCAAALAFATAGPASAHWAGARLGAAIGEVKADYPEAREIGRDAAGGRVLELPPLTYSGVAWRGARLVFDAADRLDRVTFQAQDLDYGQVKARVDAGFRAPTPPTGAVLARVPSPGAIEMRICRTGDIVEVTFEAVRFDA